MLELASKSWTIFQFSDRKGLLPVQSRWQALPVCLDAIPISGLAQAQKKPRSKRFGAILPLHLYMIGISSSSPLYCLMGDDIPRRFFQTLIRVVLAQPCGKAAAIYRTSPVGFPMPKTAICAAYHSCFWPRRDTMRSAPNRRGVNAPRANRRHTPPAPFPRRERTATRRC